MIDASELVAVAMDYGLTVDYLDCRCVFDCFGLAAFPAVVAETETETETLLLLV